MDAPMGRSPNGVEGQSPYSQGSGQAPSEAGDIAIVKVHFHALFLTFCIGATAARTVHQICKFGPKVTHPSVI